LRRWRPHATLRILTPIPSPSVYTPGTALPCSHRARPSWPSRLGERPRAGAYTGLRPWHQCVARGSCCVLPISTPTLPMLRSGSETRAGAGELWLEALAYHARGGCNVKVRRRRARRRPANQCGPHPGLEIARHRPAM